MRKINFLGFGSYLPGKVLTNFDLEKLVDTSDEWILRRTGIKTRYIVDEEDVSDLALNASLKCLNGVQDFSVEDIDAIVVATCTASKRIPAVANILQGKLSIKRQILSFDINAACSGFLYGLSIVSAMVAAGKVSKVLLVGADAMSSIVDWKDRNTCILFGDGAGAALISAGEVGGLIYDSMSCDASLCDALSADVTGKLHMDGRKVFEAAVKKLTTEINKAFDVSGISAQEIDYFVMHQANIRIIDLVSEKIGIDPYKVIVTVDKYANTSAASIPITLDHLNNEKILKKGDKLLLTAMGGGFTYGVMIVEY
ncbi:3-oxoacyl-[acyl-carrier-protein] synthase 3 [Neorickettsia helminthoeca str. Oregon]|uniref:Beta-ketoacyl-[acyl-carrier-protein] synthase III n=1 Tax=Neorickettsia helminthoeca str. Oregon TaxID=1286528 RepID=X5H4Q9_9RICK|nr:beta-ketoacyl-ACP synthase III [Neorickettsia helminthoeca]AHX11541.1 3-oxoacyl-[acyl-carrier-protein] synthase 3 [Neorickettsia helminthoeca str. Oregon]